MIAAQTCRLQGVLHFDSPIVGGARTVKVKQARVLVTRLFRAAITYSVLRYYSGVVAVVILRGRVIREP